MLNITRNAQKYGRENQKRKSRKIVDQQDMMTIDVQDTLKGTIPSISF